MSSSFSVVCKEKNLHIIESMPLAQYCGFRTGGVAEFFYAPTTGRQLQDILILSTAHNISVTILGDGSNVLAPDDVLKGLTIHTVNLNSISVEQNTVHIQSGCSVRAAAVYLANRGKRCIDFMYGMPGTVGGACWMNARCYGREISDVLLYANGYTFDGNAWEYLYKPEDFSYKKSPFQNIDWVIISCSFHTIPDIPQILWSDMIHHELDRNSKGHYIAPCAGSVFKNNRMHGNPTGKILDTLGFRNTVYNHAKVNPYHANIIINNGGATSQDVYTLSLQMKHATKKAYNIELEHEIILLGDNIRGCTI